MRDREVSRTARIARSWKVGLSIVFAMSLAGFAAFAQPGDAVPTIPPAAQPVDLGPRLEPRVIVNPSVDIMRTLRGKKAIYKLCPSCSNTDVPKGSAADLALQQLIASQQKYSQLYADITGIEAQRQKWLEETAAKLLRAARRAAGQKNTTYFEEKPRTAEEAIERRLAYVCKQLGMKAGCK